MGRKERGSEKEERGVRVRLRERERKAGRMGREEGQMERENDGWMASHPLSAGSQVSWP